MITDAQGHTLTGATTEAAAHYEQAVTAFNLYRGDPMAALDRALEAAPAFAMAHLLKAHLLAIATERVSASPGLRFYGTAPVIAIRQTSRAAASPGTEWSVLSILSILASLHLHPGLADKAGAGDVDSRHDGSAAP